MRLTVKKKIFLGLFIVVIVYSVMTMLGIYRLNQVKLYAEGITPRTEQMVLLQDFARELDELESTIEQLRVVEKEEWEKSALGNVQRLLELYFLLEDAEHEEELLELIEIVHELISSAPNISHEQASTFFTLVANIRAEHKQLLTQKSNEIHGQVLSQEYIVAQTSDHFLLVGYLILVCGVVISLVLGRSITRPIEKLQQAAEAVSKGDTSVHVNVKTNDEIGYLASAFNKMVEDIAKARTELEKDKGQLEMKAKELEKVNVRVRNLLEAKTKLLNQISHDLRTPLVPVTGLLPILKDGLKAGNSEENRDLLDRISKNMKHLTKLLNDTLSITQLDAGENTGQEKCTIQEIVGAVINNNKNLFEQKHITIKNNIAIDVPPVFAHKQKLLEVVGHLVTNAIAFMPEKKEITFTSLVKHDTVQLNVTDSGIGIEKEHLHAIFDEFFRADESRHKQASGLGLAICKRIVEKNGGNIWAESLGSGKGATFSFTVPIYRKTP